MSERLRLKIGENEIELEGDEKFIEKHLKCFLDGQVCKIRTEVPIGGAKLSTKISSPSGKPEKGLSIAEYVRAKKPKTGTDILIVLAKYLEDYKSLSEFGGIDIDKLGRDGKLKKVEKAYYGLAVKQGLLNKIKRNRYQLTLSGEDVVNAMPATVK